MSDNDLYTAMRIATSGLKAQGTRLRVVSENLAGVNSTSGTPGGDPYRRKTISFTSVYDRELGGDVVRVAEIGRDPRAFQMRFEPSHPAADAAGYVKMPNVNALVETTDMREAQRSYEANLRMMEGSRDMISKTIDILR